MRVSRKTRKKVFERDGYRCSYCDCKVRVTDNDVWNCATVDHIVPISKGGTNDMSNLTTACWECNNLLGDMFDNIADKRAWVKEQRWFSPKDVVDEIRVWERHIHYIEHKRIALCY